MRLFVSERNRQRSDRRTVTRFFAVMAVLGCAYALTALIHNVLRSW
jgi:hypothetical protein